RGRRDRPRRRTPRRGPSRRRRGRRARGPGRRSRRRAAGRGWPRRVDWAWRQLNGCGMDLEQRTLEGLDWPVLVQAWGRSARTTLGAEAIASMRPLRDVGAVRAAWDAVDELRRLEDSGVVVPVGDVQDVRPQLGRAERGQVLEGPALLQAGRSLLALVQLEKLLHRHADEAPVLATIASVIHLDAAVVDELNRAFDPTGQLSSVTFPVLGELRRAIQSLHEEIRATLDR